MVGGNITALIQTKTTTENIIGEVTSSWSDLLYINGWLDLTSGSSSTRTYKTKSEISTHVFICDYSKSVRDLDITACRCIINSRIYEIKFIDDPMELHDHLEITLNLEGVSNG